MPCEFKYINVNVRNIEDVWIMLVWLYIHWGWRVCVCVWYSLHALQVKQPSWYRLPIAWHAWPAPYTAWLHFTQLPAKDQEHTLSISLYIPCHQCMTLQFRCNNYIYLFFTSKLFDRTVTGFARFIFTFVCMWLFSSLLNNANAKQPYCGIREFPVVKSSFRPQTPF